MNVGHVQHSYIILTDSGDQVTVDKLFITAGHTRQRSSFEAGHERVISELYPLPSSVEKIPTETVVGIEGMGLSAIDTIAALTVGRGGQFDRSTETRYAYHASGSEPKILLFSRNGLPYRARPDTTINIRRHKAIFLTEEAISFMRTRTMNGQLDFENDVLPLLLNEMRAVFYLKHIQLNEPHCEDENRLRNHLLK
ncbi:MAG: hypothetical protein JKX94_06770, partial [Sneathiella sp.]|nr:hypothetical protein [Sneathiella sp.]